MMISVALLGYGAAGTLVARAAQRPLLPRFARGLRRRRRAVRRYGGRRFPARPAGRASIRSRSSGIPQQPLRLLADLRSAVRSLLLRRDLRSASTFTRFAGEARIASTASTSSAPAAGSLGRSSPRCSWLAPTDALRLVGATRARRGSWWRWFETAATRALPASCCASRARARPARRCRRAGVSLRLVRIQGADPDAAGIAARGSLRNARARWASSPWSRAEVAVPARARNEPQRDDRAATATRRLHRRRRRRARSTRYDGAAQPLAYLDFLTSALPYHLLARAARAGARAQGRAAEVLQALEHGARAASMPVELDPQVIDLVQQQLRELFGATVQRARRARAHRRSARLRRCEPRPLRSHPGRARSTHSAHRPPGSTRSRELPVHGRGAAATICNASSRAASSRSRAGLTCRRATS